jgi:rSAM/selenodomain-associated transferase 2
MRVSAIIPALNEEALLPNLLEEIRRQGAEIIVADGGSRDQTIPIALHFGARIAVTAQGRGRQLNAGAYIATGEIFIFVHADSILPYDALSTVAETLQKGPYVGGAFSIAVDSTRPSFRFIYRAANWRSRRLALPYGDQAIFVLSSVFKKMGGYREMSIMEDVDFMRRLRRIGPTVILPQVVTTSARRLQREGVVYSTFRNMTLAALFLMGVRPHLLQRYYPHIR